MGWAFMYVGKTRDVGTLYSETILHVQNGPRSVCEGVNNSRRGGK